MRSNKNKISTFILITRVWRTLRPRRKTQIILNGFISLLSGLAEMFSLAALAPFLTLLTDPRSIWSIGIVKRFSLTLGFESPTELLLPVTLVFIFGALLAASIRLLNLWLNCRLAAIIGSDISHKAYKKTLYQPYEFHLKNNSSKIIATITTQINITVSSIDYMLQLISSFIIISSLLITMFFLELQIAFLTTLFFGLIYFLIAIFVKNKLGKNSLIVANETNKQFKALQEGLGAIREVILDGLQDIYLRIYSKAEVPRRIRQASSQFLAVFPRYSLEAIGLATLSAIALFITLQKQSSTAVIPAIGIIALGAQRLLPSLQQFYSAWAAIRANKSTVLQVLNTIEKKMEPIENQNNYKPIIFKKNIKIKNLFYNYNENTNLIKNVNLTINKGDKVALIGSTGSGKSTFIDLIIGLLRPKKGSIFIDEINLNDKNHPERIYQWRKIISHVPQFIYLADSSIAENIAFGIPKNKIDMSRVRYAARLCQISNFIESTSKGYETNVGERGVRLSGGQKQRIGIARALYKEAKILIFDEATNALDEITEDAIIQTIKKLPSEVTIIMISHKYRNLEFCNRFFKIDNNSIKEITYDQ